MLWGSYNTNTCRKINQEEKKTIDHFQYQYDDKDVIVLDDSDSEVEEKEPEREAPKVDQLLLPHKGKPLTVKIRVNEKQVETFDIYDEDPMEYLYVDICNQFQVELKAVRLIVDGVTLPLDTSASVGG